MNAFEVFVMFSAVDHLTGPMRRMAADMGMVEKHTKAVEMQLTRLKSTMLVGGAITGFGAVMAKGLLSAAEAAGHLQMSIKTVQQALKLNNAEFEKAQNLAQTAGIPTVFASEDVGQIMRAMATSGLKKEQVLDPQFLQQFVNFADVQHIAKHENAPDVVAAAVRMAHMYQIYSPEQTKPFLDKLNAALMHSHESAEQFATTFKYIANQAKTMGVSATDTLTTTAYLSRIGFGSGRGGTNFATFLSHSILGSTGAKADASMRAAGFVRDGRSVFTDAKGRFVGIEKTVEIMQDFAKRFGNDANKMSPLLHNIFGTQGFRIASALTSKGAAEQYKAVSKEIAETNRVNEMQEEFNKTWEGQMRQLKSVLLDVWQNFGKSMLPALTKGLAVLNKWAENLLHFTQANPELMKMIGSFTMAATAVSLVVGPLMVMVGALGYIATSGVITAGIGMLGTALSVAALRIVPVIAGVALLREAWVRNWFGIQQKVASVIKWFKDNWPYIEEAVKTSAEQIKTNWGYAMDALESSAAKLKQLWEDISHTITLTMQDFKRNAQAIKDFFTAPWNKANGGSVFPTMPMGVSAHAMGTDYAPGGWSIVGERGPEMVNLPRGSKVIPNHRLGGVNVGDIHIHAQPNQSPREIAREVMRQIGTLARNRSYGSPDTVASAWS